MRALLLLLFFGVAAAWAAVLALTIALTGIVPATLGAMKTAGGLDSLFWDSLGMNILLIVLVCIPGLLAYLIVGMWSWMKGDRKLAFWRVGVVMLYVCLYVLAFNVATWPMVQGTINVAAVVIGLSVLSGGCRFVWRTHRSPVTAVAIIVAILIGVVLLGVAWCVVEPGAPRPEALLILWLGLFLTFVGVFGGAANIIAWTGFDTWRIVRWLGVLAAIGLGVYLALDPPGALSLPKWDETVKDDPKAGECMAAQMPLAANGWTGEYAHAILADSVYYADPIALSDDEVRTLSNDVELSWASSAKYRLAIEFLNTFDTVPSIHVDDGAPAINAHDLRQATQLYCLNARLKAAEDLHVQGIARLGILCSVARKAMPQSATMAEHAMWSDVAMATMNVARKITADPATPPHALRVIARRFPHVDQQALLPLRAVRREMEEFPRDTRGMATDMPRFAKATGCGVATNSHLANVVLPYLYRKNATLQAYLKLMLPQVENATNGAIAAANFAAAKALHRATPEPMNLTGWMLVNAEVFDVAHAAIKAKTVADVAGEIEAIVSKLLSDQGSETTSAAEKPQTDVRDK